MLLRGYVTNNDKKYNNQKNKISDIDKRFKYNSTYEPIRGSDIFNELPPKNIKNQPDYQYLAKYELYYEKKNLEEKFHPKRLKKLKSHSTLNINQNNNNPNKQYSISKNNVYNINNLRYSYDPYNTTYNASYTPNRINGDILVGNNRYLGTGVAYNSRKQKIEFLKSNIFYDRDKYNQNNNLKDNFDPKNINHNNWYTNLDWRNNKSELIFYQDNQKEFYDNNSKANKQYFDQYK
jgi:hypothetical protein